MERDVEKSTLDVLALTSVMAVLAGAAFSVSGASWRFAAYFSIVGSLFDIMFTHDFFSRLLKRNSRFPWLAFLSSVVPLTFVSGPFLSGWAVNDLGAAAVRGFWLGSPPASGFSVLAALRLLRVTRPFWISTDAKTLGGPPRISGYRVAAVVGIAAMLAGAFASDAKLIPGPARTHEASRSAAMTTLAAARDDAERFVAAQAAQALAMRVLGQPVLGAGSGLFPAEYAVESFEGIEAWFSTADERRARAAAAAMATLASLAAATAYAAAGRTRRGAGRRPRKDCADGSSPDGGDCDGNDLRIRRRRDVPAGKAELTGILGKRPY